MDLTDAAKLKALLGQADLNLDRDDLSQAAHRLEQAGLIDGATIVREAATKADTRASREIRAILADPLEHNRKTNFAGLYQRNLVTLADLEAAGLDDDNLDFIERSKVIRKFHR